VAGEPGYLVAGEADYPVAEVGYLLVAAAGSHHFQAGQIRRGSGRCHQAHRHRPDLVVAAGSRYFQAALLVWGRHPWYLLPHPYRNHWFVPARVKH
jgi:hypothetical protein